MADLVRDGGEAEAKSIYSEIFTEGMTQAEGLAREYSDGPGAAEGGIMGYVKKGDLLPQIEDIVFKLNEGQTSGIIQSQLGYHIFKLEEKKVLRSKELSEVRQEIEEYLYREKANEKLKGWIDSLAKSAYIEFK